MNIFAFSGDAQLSALWIDDVRKNKMITETCQILSTVMNVLDPHHGKDVYKSFNPKHGSILWAMYSSGNYSWLLNYVTYLLEQRGPVLSGEPHACSRLILEVFPQWLCNADCFDLHKKTRFSNNAANADIGVSFKHIQNPILAYRMYINVRWQTDSIPLTWIWGEQPKWRR